MGTSGFVPKGQGEIGGSCHHPPPGFAPHERARRPAGGRGVVVPFVSWISLLCWSSRLTLAAMRGGETDFFVFRISRGRRRSLGSVPGCTRRSLNGRSRRRGPGAVTRREGLRKAAGASRVQPLRPARRGRSFLARDNLKCAAGLFEAARAGKSVPTVIVPPSRAVLGPL